MPHCELRQISTLPLYIVDPPTSLSAPEVLQDAAGGTKVGSRHTADVALILFLLCALVLQTPVNENDSWLAGVVGNNLIFIEVLLTCS